MSHFPQLKIDDWEPTREILQGYIQVLGQIRAALTPPQKYKEQFTLQTTATGLTTTPMPIGSDTVEMRLDFFGNLLILTTSRGEIWQKPLLNMTPAALYTATVELFAELETTLPVNNRFSDKESKNYDVDAVEKYWKILAQIDAIFKQFKGKVRTETTPVVFVPDRFELMFHCLSGRLIPGADANNPEKSDERLTFSFSTGNIDVSESHFCAIATPETTEILNIALPTDAEWNSRGFQGIVMMYDTFRQVNDPKAHLLNFLQSIQTETFTAMKSSR
jgi:hypothetical protein